MYARLLEQLRGGRARRLRRALRYLYAGGSPLDPDAQARGRGSASASRCTTATASPRASPTVAQTRLDAPRDDTSVGPPIPGVEVRIVDARRSATSPPARSGELWVRGPNVMRGYYRDPQATARRDHARRLAATPATWRAQEADGALFIVGRIKELIIRSGFNVYPREVEAVLNAHPAVAQSAVVGRPVADGNEEVVAFVELAAGRVADAAELAAHAAQQLAPYKRPERDPHHDRAARVAHRQGACAAS